MRFNSGCSNVRPEFVTVLNKRSGPALAKARFERSSLRHTIADAP